MLAASGMKILIVEDDPKTRQLLVQGLGEAGHRCVPAANGEEALHQLEARNGIELVLLDVMMPVCDGWQVLERLRGWGDLTPVVLLSAKHELEDRVRGLRNGADDYLVKPFSWDELEARIEAVGRRAAPALHVGDLEIDLDNRLVRCGANLIEPSPREFALLMYLARRPGRTIGRRKLLSEVWGIDFDPETNLVEVTILRLRRRLKVSRSTQIATVPSRGYTLQVRAPTPGAS